ncbi:hypothetical protein HOF65_08385 [bacterium]|nr:hypothetical protein [bacterium]
MSSSFHASFFTSSFDDSSAFAPFTGSLVGSFSGSTFGSFHSNSFNMSNHF